MSAKQEKLNRAELRRIMRNMLPKYRHAFAMEIKKKQAWMAVSFIFMVLSLFLAVSHFFEVLQ